MNRRTAVAALAVLCLTVAACQKADTRRINQANFDKIKSGMTQSDVELMLGPGTEVTGGDGLGGTAVSGVGVTGGLDQQSTGRPALRWFRYGVDNTHILVCYNRQDKVHDGHDAIKSKGLK